MVISCCITRGRWAILLLAGGLSLLGCRMAGEPPIEFDSAAIRQAAAEAVETSTSQVRQASSEVPVEAATLAPPRLLNDLEPDNYLALTLDQVVQVGLASSPVFRDLGGRLVQSPETASTILEPAITATDATEGVEAALSAFDAQISANIFAGKNDRALNNELLVGGTNFYQQDLTTSTFEIAKTSATGARYAFREFIEYDANNAPRNLFGSAWTTWMDFEVRQPLRQGAGVAFNRLAGPDSTPGRINGVMVARVNADISLLDFEIGLRNLISDLENAYWDLYFAYRNLEAAIAARDRALETWRAYQEKRATGAADAVSEAQAREQYYRFQEEVQTALNGRVIDGTQTNNGSSGGTFRGVNGVLVAERRLRLLMGMPINDDTLIRPAYDPTFVKVVFGWQDSLNEALARRAELRRQRTVIELRNMELVANRNFLLPRIDMFARYRFRGFGKDLYGGPDAQPPLDNAIQELLGGDYQEWQLGVEGGLPIGFRRAHNAVKNAELKLAREQIVLREQERSIVHNLSNAFGELERSYATVQTAFNRRVAAEEFYQALETRFQTGVQVDANLLLDAQRRLADAEIRYFQALSEYVLAVKNVHFEKGSLMEYNEVHLVDHDAVQRPHSVNWTRAAPQAGEVISEQVLEEGSAPSPLLEVLPGQRADEFEDRVIDVLPDEPDAGDEPPWSGPLESQTRNARGPAAEPQRARDADWKNTAAVAEPAANAAAAKATAAKATADEATLAGGAVADGTQAAASAQYLDEEQAARLFQGLMRPASSAENIPAPPFPGERSGDGFALPWRTGQGPAPAAPPRWRQYAQPTSGEADAGADDKSGSSASRASWAPAAVKTDWPSPESRASFTPSVPEVEEPVDGATPLPRAWAPGSATHAPSGLPAPPTEREPLRRLPSVQ